MNWRRRMRPSGKDHGLCQGLKASTFSAPMCALGHKRRFAMLKPMSGPEADISRRGAMSALPPKNISRHTFIRDLAVQFRGKRCVFFGDRGAVT